MVRAIFFDFDGTLLPMDEKVFMKGLFGMYMAYYAKLGYDPNAFLELLMDSTKKIMMHDDGKNCGEMWWECYEEKFGKADEAERAKLYWVYEKEFEKVKEFTRPNPLAKEIVHFVKEHYDLCVLSTNPLFPMIGTRKRVEFIDLKPEDFDYITAYETSSYCKPNPKYFLEVMDHLGLKPEEVVLFGNDVQEDAECAEKVGIKTYLIDGCIIDRKGNKDKYKVIQMDEVIDVLKNEVGLYR